MFYTNNEAELQDLGQKIGYHLEEGDILILTGDLGSGKTTLTKGIGKALGISQMIKSPTYTIVREYTGDTTLYHLDVYRIGDDPDSIDLDEFLFGSGITVIEWGELLDPHLFNDYLEVIIHKEDQGRRVELQSHGTRSETILRKVNAEN
ncbi:YjeE family ATPase [Streptococcus urinalis FB127-CNA-2]|uniref:tRNA threonylcarbamoyladenosine biosynthesis protein TsaE n=1 Tax=Streptococcus urinalis 2285-97 TaxID=764291 RepID=G5KI60_9STRE|nr:tRNA (adenosine(37)-N6)-threonylcarbamoyltransferase complex ATPase subunit type 1 TsaE [Streptococcus urinalis]EHJ55737.1 hydrolase, P-loop family [Streptococcus urinalis 2285-97]EKS20548.1 YjeE family ATPase [Streptococcus urinalis FB127-CNA-2]VEF31241.1 ATP/GTP binding protein-P-loop hydrolase [Streptococcus urinalis]